MFATLQLKLQVNIVSMVQEIIVYNNYPSACKILVLQTAHKMNSQLITGFPRDPVRLIHNGMKIAFKYLMYRGLCAVTFQISHQYIQP